MHGVKLDVMDQQPPKNRLGREAEGDASRPKHDPGLKRLFSHRRMLADLLCLLPEGLTEGFDLNTLRRLPAEHVGDALRSRRSDMPWCIDFLPSTGRPSDGRGVTGPRNESSSAEWTSPPAQVSSSPPALVHPGVCLLLVEFHSTVDPRMAERAFSRGARGGTPRRKNAGVRRDAAR